MIDIYPAILTNDRDEFLKCVNMFLKYGNIDIDIIEKPFSDNETLGIEEVLSFEELGGIINPGFHLMVDNPESMTEKIISSNLNSFRIFVHQEGVDNSLKYMKSRDFFLGIAIKLDSELRDLEFYQNFDEVQIMSVELGFQGGGFQEKSLEKVDRLRGLGYNGRVSLDGGINPSTAKALRGHLVDRVSVGSFFQNSSDFESSYKTLNEALNS